MSLASHHHIPSPLSLSPTQFSPLPGFRQQLLPILKNIMLKASIAFWAITLLTLACISPEVRAKLNYLRFADAKTNCSTVPGSRGWNCVHL